MPSFRTGCRRVIHPFEWVHWMAEWVVKFFKRLPWTSKWLTHQFERVHRTTERVIKFFEWLTRMGEQLTYPFQRLIKISKRVPQTTERFFTDNYLSKWSHFTTGHPVSPGMKLLLYLINNNYCLWTCISIWDCNFSKHYIRKTPWLYWKIF